MPTFAETASAFRNRFRFQEPSDPASDSVRSSPALFKSASKDNLVQSSAAAVAAIGSLGQSDDVEVSGGPSDRTFELQEDPSFWKDHNVQVVIRIRPLSNSEISLKGYNKCVRQESCQTITWTGHPESRFTFDLVADENVSQEKLFKLAGLPMVDNCMGGYNSCMFAYGQTGSGKTHTMLGDIEGGTRRHSVNCGITPRVFEYLFSRIQKEKESRRDEKLKYTCKCSFLEIYNEQILDLLEPSSVNLQIREDAKKGVHVENLTEFEVSSARDVIQQLVQGAANRKVAATNMNRASSRSHSVFTCVIESKWECQGVTHHRFARLNLVDLAGSERQKSSGAEGERLKEATNINKSLSTLGLVIMNLVNISNGKSQHVPYRDSKLTFLLQDSLGGNSKTTIIANITPSSCCALETLSTLKFAQRAKFIRNNAIVNEDALGDVLSMRAQIQQLKKEINRLRGLVNGGAENQENDNWNISFPGSPGSFKWDAGEGSFSPLTTEKKTTQKRHYEAALVGAFRREQDKEIQLRALAAENEATIVLAKQREREIQSLKMRLRFREAGIKRLEALVSGKISAETHLLEEKSELLKEIEVLRNQVDRNQEVTRFAMENLRLKEELRRLQSFCEDGEREMMNEQIKTLQNKLLEALDWKLMHEKDPAIVQDSPMPWDSSINAENEFLRIQAIQNQKEVEALRKNLNACLEAKEKLERRVDELVSQLEEETKSANIQKEAVSQHLQVDLSVSPTIKGMTFDASNNQIELKTMVDAIAAASQREAEAHETTITLAKENEELRMKLKVLIEDNNKLIELYEGVVAEGNTKSVLIEDNNKLIELYEGVVAEGNTKSGNAFQAVNGDEECHENTDHDENYHVETKEVEGLEHQLSEMHEENERLMGLYEKAMQERDEFKKMLCSNEKNNVGEKEDFNCPEKLVEVDEERVYWSEDGKENSELRNTSSKSDEPSELDFSGSNELETSVMDRLEIAMDGLEIVHPEDPVVDEEKRNPIEEWGNVIADNENFKMESNAEPAEIKVSEEELNLARMKLEMAQDMLANAAKAVSFFGLLEKANINIDKLVREIEAVENSVQIKHQEIAALKLLSFEAHERKTVTDNKLIALRSSLSSISSSVNYWEQREAHARARLDSSSCSLEQKKEEMTHLQVRKEEIEGAHIKARESETAIRNNIECLKSKLQDAENLRKTEKVLFEIDNLDRTDIPVQRNWQLSKAGELLKSEEERTKLRDEIRQSRERLGVIQKEMGDLRRKSEALDNEIQTIEEEITKYLRTVEEAKLGLENVLEENEMLYKMRDEGRREVERMIIEYHQRFYESALKEEEAKLCEREVKAAVSILDELKAARTAATQNKMRLLHDNQHVFALPNADDDSCCVFANVEEELGNIQRSVFDAKSLLVTNDR
ncbi:kinesin-like protein KIN-12G [Magnolia sinica]|uniref:kinesin-like protein KIN-12G n=1 Tax=Magnolia sinica TaxID=86752 RepID=UPI00265AD98F|nr:kinesin-like protein KIN-12G [Magnolia sinica]